MFISLLLLLILFNAPIDSEWEMLSKVNGYYNQVPYKEDIDNYGVWDHWATPQEFMVNGGDCEDYAIAKMFRLLELGVSANRLKLQLAWNDERKHMVLLYQEKSGQWLTLDNNVNSIEPIQFRDDLILIKDDI